MIQRETRKAIDGAQVSLKRHVNEANETESKYPVNNISRGGLRFTASEDFDIDERVELTLHLTNGHTHNLHGRICYCHDNNGNNQHDYGVSFLDPYLAFE